MIIFVNIPDLIHFYMKKNILFILVLMAFATGMRSQITAGLREQWLTGVTYGVSSYAYSTDSMTVCEVVVDTGLNCTMSSLGPSAGLYTSNAFYFVYTLPYAGDYAVFQHINTSGSVPAIYGSCHGIYSDSIPVTPTDCHASFFLAPDPSVPNEWVLNDFSTGSGTLSYSWDFGDGTVSTLANPTHLYSSIGNYMICLTVSSGTCTDTYCDTAFVDMSHAGNGVLSLRTMRAPVGITEHAEIPGLLLYPNPAEDELTLESEFMKGTPDTQLRVIDVLGREVISIAGFSAPGKIDISALESGMYLLKISNSNGQAVRSFIKK